MAEDDSTFYSATDQLLSQRTRRQPALDARKEAERVAHNSDSHVPVSAGKTGSNQPMKIVSRSGKSIGSNQKPMMVSRADEPNIVNVANQQQLQNIVKERARLMASKNAQLAK